MLHRPRTAFVRTQGPRAPNVAPGANDSANVADVCASLQEKRLHREQPSNGFPLRSQQEGHTKAAQNLFEPFLSTTRKREA